MTPDRSWKEEDEKEEEDSDYVHAQQNNRSYYFNLTRKFFEQLLVSVGEILFFRPIAKISRLLNTRGHVRINFHM
jgi:hypothetical protein